MKKEEFLKSIFGLKHRDGYDIIDEKDLDIVNINNEFKLCITIPMHDSYEDSYVLSKEDKQAYMIKEVYEEDRQITKEVDICFNAIYIGCAEGKLYIVDTEDVEGLDLNEILSLIQEDKIKYETTDFGFIQNGEGKTIIDDEYENRVLTLPIEEDKEICCLEEDLI